MNFLAFLFGWWVFKPYSIFVAMILRLRGIKVGHNFYIQGVPFLKLRGKSGTIIIGDNVRVNGHIDLRNRENGRIIIEDDVMLDTGCRLVAANDSLLLIRKGAALGCYCIVNCGIGIEIGEDARLAGYCYLQDSDYGLRRSMSLKSQPFTYGKIVLGREAWLAAHVTVLKDTTISEGAVVGANAVVTKDLSAFSINAGIPARPIAMRSD
ncbi:MAG: acyltransferase [Alphaproteobacteria bacterium]|nr:acyltransferase [Alphaproteobacteria bacterium]